MGKDLKLFGYLFLSCIFWGGVLALGDFILGILIEPTLYKIYLVEDGIYSLIFAHGIYLALAFLIYLFLLIFLFFQRIFIQENIFSLISGSFLGIMFFLYAPCFLNFANRWVFGICLFFILTTGIFLGGGLIQFLKRWLRDWKEQVFFPLWLWLGLFSSGSFFLIIFSQVNLSLLFRLTYLLGGVLIFGLTFGLSVISWRKRKLGAIFSLGIIIFSALLLPLFFFSPKPTLPHPTLTPSRPRNIIWIVADALRSDGLGIYGGENHTPTLDQLAQQGIWFKEVISQGSWTVPSVASYFTSQYPLVFLNQGELESYEVPSSYRFFAEQVQRYGYYTLALCANLGLRTHGFLRGFKDMYLLHQKVRFHLRFRFLPVAYCWEKIICRFFHLRLFPDTVKLLTRRTVKFLKNPREPFFLYIHYMDPHHPYEPSREYLKGIKYQGPVLVPYSSYPDELFYQNYYKGFTQQKVEKKDKESQRFVHQLYLAEVRYLDHYLAQIINTLKKEGLVERTLVVFTADHGEEFWEHNRNQHGYTLYQEVLKVPLILWGAGINPGVVERRIELIDLVPSLYEYLGIEPEPPVQGRSFWKLISLPDASLHSFYFSQGGIIQLIQAVQNDRYKLIYYPSSGEYELYDLITDPKEEKNIFSPHHPAFLLLKAELEKWREKNLYLREKIIGEKVIDREKKKLVREKLRSLGYIR